MRLDGLLTLIAITHGDLGGLMNLTRYPEQMGENVLKFYVKKASSSCIGIALEQERMRRLRGRKT